MTSNWQLPYPSQRQPVFARNAVATSQPLAAQAGLRMLLQGGNAVDAALASAIALTVVEPSGCGIGSDAFAIVWDGEKLHGINGSGRAPAAWTAERFAGNDRMPVIGWESVTVPGSVSAWVELSKRFGALPFAKVFEPAVEYARGGFQLGPLTARHYLQASKVYRDFAAFSEHFLPGGHVPKPGEVVFYGDTADTLESIAATEGVSFYRGALAEKMATAAARVGGGLTEDDLAAHEAQWVDPIAVPYRDVVVHEIPPNGQGLTALIALGILQNRDIAQYPVDSADSVHLQVEAVKLAWAEASAHIADVDHMVQATSTFLDPLLHRHLAEMIDMREARDRASVVPASDDTVYLSTADASGMMVSMIQSNFRGFGSGCVVPETGIHMHNRGSGFSLIDGHPNQVGPSKRPFHTIIPGFSTRDGMADMSFGVMGGHMQAQGHVQLIVRCEDYGQNPQAASDAPRFHMREDGVLMLEAGFGDAVVAELRSRGHDVLVAPPGNPFGGAQLIRCMPVGYCAASDHRKEGLAVGY